MTDAAPPETPIIPDDIQELSFEAALSELEEIVRRLEAGQVDLENSIDMYTRGTQLKQHCEAKLRAAKERVDQIILGAEGAVSSKPADLG